MSTCGELLTELQPAGPRRRVAPFLHHISKAEPAARRTIGLKAPRKQPRILTAARCRRSWTRATGCGTACLFAVLHDTGVRIGEALGLRHEDWPRPSGR